MMNNPTAQAARSTTAPGPSRTAFDHLDTLVRVTTVRSWVYLSTLFAVGVGAVVFAMLYQVPTKVDGEGLLLIQQDRLVLVRARATGRLALLNARQGDWVNAGDIIGRIAQEELKDQIQQAQARLADLRSQHQELTRFEDEERQSKTAAIARLRETLVRARNDSMEKQTLATRLVVSADRLRAVKYMGDLELLESREKLYDVRDDLNKGETRLAEMELDQVTSENTRKRANLERRLKIGELVTKLKLDLDKLERTSQVVSPARGQVAQVQCAIGGLVHEGAPVVLLHAPKVERGPDDDGPAYDTIVFVAAGEGKRIEPDNEVEVVPATVKREEHGFIRGRVVAISELPATRLAMEAALEHPELVESFLKRYAPGVVLRVQVKLDPDESPRSRAGGGAGRGPTNPFRWSSTSGRDQPLKTGTMCQASIVVERRRLIRLILPWTRKVSGTD